MAVEARLAKPAGTALHIDVLAKCKVVGSSHVELLRKGEARFFGCPKLDNVAVFAVLAKILRIVMGLLDYFTDAGYSCIKSSNGGFTRRKL